MCGYGVIDMPFLAMYLFEGLELQSVEVNYLFFKFQWMYILCNVWWLHACFVICCVAALLFCCLLCECIIVLLSAL